MEGKTRAPHKAGCMCVVCKAKRAKLEIPEVLAEPEIVAPPPLPPPLPARVRLDSLCMAAKFLFGGQKHRVGDKLEGLVVCHNTATNESATLGGSTMVEPIK